MDHNDLGRYQDMIKREARKEARAAKAAAKRKTLIRREPWCRDCGEQGETTGHQTCQYPQDHE